MAQEAGTPNWAHQTIWTGDNLLIMRGMNSACVDLIYLDPPFNSKVDYAAPIGSEAAGAEFKDTWSLSDVDVEWINLIETKHPALHRVLLAAMTNSDKSYLAYMAIRLLEMKRILKPTGAIYLHCDPTMGHYLKLLMDAVFHPSSFVADITWQRTSSHNDKLFGSVRDMILCYGAKPGNWDDVRIPLTKEYIEKHYRFEDSRGRFRKGDLTAAGTRQGESGLPWKGADPGKRGRHWGVPSMGKYAKHIDRELLPGYLKLDGILDRLDALDEADLIAWPNKLDGMPQLKRYLQPGQGKLPTNLWTDISPVSARSKEATGYPTQKPLALLERIVAASSNVGDMVLDPFCGCATACIAAEKLQRQWVGIDISPTAADLVDGRLRKEVPLETQRAIHREGVLQRTDLGELPHYRTHKKRLFADQKGYCEGCSTSFGYYHLEVDHITARSKGGTDHIENLQLLCTRCNRVKGNRNMAYLKAKLQMM